MSKSKILIIVDVQEKFRSSFPTETYIEDLNKACNKYDQVYQVWDATEDADKPDFVFNGQIRDFKKTFGYDFKLSELEGLIPVTHLPFYNIVRTNAVKRGDNAPMRDGDTLVYVGGEHEWFKCPRELATFLKDLGLTENEVTFVGGAASKCLLDVVVAALSFNVKCEVDLDLVYGKGYDVKEPGPASPEPESE